MCGSEHVVIINVEKKLAELKSEIETLKIRIFDLESKNYQK
ncbi:hypothetical protein [Metabacillus idriensis]|nr:hypothetical protein [Metabacillus idriensis]